MNQSSEQSFKQSSEQSHQQYPFGKRYFGQIIVKGQDTLTNELTGHNQLFIGTIEEYFNEIGIEYGEIKIDGYSTAARVDEYIQSMIENNATPTSNILFIAINERSMIRCYPNCHNANTVNKKYTCKIAWVTNNVISHSTISSIKDEIIASECDNYIPRNRSQRYKDSMDTCMVSLFGLPKGR